MFHRDVCNRACPPSRNLPAGAAEAMDLAWSIGHRYSL
jgi:hypothetical protein